MDFSDCRFEGGYNAMVDDVDRMALAGIRL